MDSDVSALSGRVRQGDRHYADRTHILCVAAYLMRQVLAQHARWRNASKRDGGGATIAWKDALDFSPERAWTVIAIDDALSSFPSMSAEKARFVELRFYGSITAEEISELTGASVHRVRHGLRIAMAWLHREVNGASVQRQRE